MLPIHHAKLVVQQASRNEIYRDIIRISADDRGDLAKGQICRVSAGGQEALGIVRGSTEVGFILLDDALRDRLELDIGKSYDFTLQQVGFLGELHWAWSATDPAYRLAAKLGALSFWLGMISLLLGAIALFK